MRFSPLRLAALNLALAVVYFLSARLGLSLAIPYRQVTLIWPPTGIALAAVWLGGYRLLPGLVAGAFITNISIGGPLVFALIVAFGNPLAAVVGVALLRRAGFHPAMDRIRDTLALAPLAAGLGAVTSATLGTLGLVITREIAAPDLVLAWSTWWAGDALGVLVLAPTLLTWSAAAGGRLPGGGRLPAWQALEAAALGAGLLAIGLAVYSGGLPHPFAESLSYAAYPFVIWSALRFGPRGASLSTLAGATLAIAGAATGQGAFAHGESGVAYLDLVYLSGFIATLATTGMLLAAAASARRDAEAALRQELGLREQTVMALQASERRYRAIVEDQTNLIYRARPDGLVTYVNQAFIRFFHKPVAELMGSHFEPPIHLDDQAIVADKQAQSSPDQPVVTYWHRAPLAGGETRWLQWTRRALYDPRGRPFEFQYVGQDITDLKLAEEGLKRRNRELASLNEMALAFTQAREPERIAGAALDKILEALEGDGGWIHLRDASGVLKLAAERGLPLQAAAAIHEIDWPARHPHAAARGQPDEPGEEEKARTLAKAVLQDIRQRLRDLPEVHAAALRARGEVLGSVGFFYLQPREPSAGRDSLFATLVNATSVALDNTRLAEQASEIEILRAVDRLRSELIAHVSHELRTPLGLIILFCTTLQRQKDPEQREKRMDEFLGYIHAEALKLEQIVNNLLNLSRVQSERLRLEKRHVDLARLVQDTARNLRPRLAQHHWACELPAQPLLAWVDPARFEQVLRNLIENAAKYSPPDSQIILRGGSRETGIYLQVSDQGVGIAPADIEHIFEPFYRADNPQVWQVDGLGLGLAICRHIVEAHGGRIWAESILGQGSTFHISLPLEQA